ncbi:hypothetical protein EDF32_0067 [Cellulomonas sp. PhB143]|nr:hypothetical protein EDF32_0067 [Cellulomonas sp. PhB143]
MTVTDAPERSRFEIRTADGDLVGTAAYTRHDAVTVLTHTEVDDAVEGQGAGSTLVRGALDAIRSNGGKAVALCPFVAGYVERHPEYADLLQPED